MSLPWCLNRLRLAQRWSAGKQLAQFDFSAADGAPKNRITALTQHKNWVNQRENVLLFGPSGVGKTHLACAIGYALIEKSVRIKFTSATGIVQELQRAKVQLCVADALSRMDKYAVITNYCGRYRLWEEKQRRNAGVI